MKLWRVESKGPCRWHVVAWWDTKKRAQWFIDNLANPVLRFRVLLDRHPERHRDWPERIGGG